MCVCVWGGGGGKRGEEKGGRKKGRVRWIILEKADLPLTKKDANIFKDKFLDLYFRCFEFIQLAPQGIIKSHVTVM